MIWALFQFKKEKKNFCGGRLTRDKDGMQTTFLVPSSSDPEAMIDT